MVATDTIFSDTPAVDNGSTCAQIFVGMDTLVTDAYGFKSDGEFVSTLEDNIRKWGAMSKLVNNRAQSELSNKVLDILRNYTIDDWQSEPYHKHQNPNKRRYQTVKQHTNAALDKSGAPPKAWLLALLYAIFLLNQVASETWVGKPLWNFSPDSPRTFPSYSCSVSGSHSIFPLATPCLTPISLVFRPIQLNDWGDLSVLANPFVTRSLSKFSLTTLKRSCTGLRFVRRLLSASPDWNRRAEPAGTPDFAPTPSAPTINDVPTSTEIVRSPTRDKSNGTKQHMSIIAPDDLLTRTYLTEPDETGQRFRAKIVEKIVSLEEGLEQHPDRNKFLVRFEGTDRLDELVAYNQVLEALESDLLDPDEQLWSFKDIIAHESPLTRDSPSYMIQLQCPHSLGRRVAYLRAIEDHCCG